MSIVEFDVSTACETHTSERSESIQARDVAAPGGSVVMGTLIGFADEGQSPLVIYPDQPGAAAIRAGTIVDVYGIHIGRQVVLSFDRGDLHQPIIIGLLRNPQKCPLPRQSGQVEVDADGERVVVTAKNQLVLRCGKASITLTKAGKVIIDGAYVVSQSSGVNRIKGGSVQLN